MNFQHNFENDLQKKNTFTYEIQKCPKDFKSNSLDHNMDTLRQKT